MLKVQLGMLGILFLTSFWALFQIDIKSTQIVLLPRPFFNQWEEEGAGFVVNTKGCRIPDLKTLDPKIKQFIYKEKAIECGTIGPLVSANQSWLYLEKGAFENYNVTNQDKLDCCYRPFWRTSHHPNDKGIKYSSQCHTFSEAVEPEEDFVRVECSLNKQIIYKDFFAFVHKADEVGRGDSNDKVSVLIVGIDAVSRLNLYRQMPKTVAFLKEELSAIELLGYNKVEDNTFPNLVPVLTGLSESELVATCWPNTKTKFDACPLIWKNYSGAGFMTGFGEDSAWMGIFNYLKNGFDEQPTNFYLQPFDLTAEDEIGHSTRLNSRLCLGQRKVYRVFLDIVYKFTLALLDRLSFGFFWSSSLSHDFLNLPNLGDDDYADFLRGLQESGVTQRSVVIVMSDHGIRWGSMRETYQGYLEERLPFLFFSFPPRLMVKYPLAMANLYKNRRRLTTPFDLHETLKEFLDLKGIRDESLVERTQALRKQGQMPRGISLFLPISEERTCQTANISDHWCTCHQSEEVNLNDTGVVRSSKILIDYINLMTVGFSQCSKLSVHSIVSARVELPTSHRAKNRDIVLIDYQLIIESVPGHGMFEATVRNDVIKDNFEIVGRVSRINTYGNQSSCVSHYRLKLYCYCQVS